MKLGRGPPLPLPLLLLLFQLADAATQTVMNDAPTLMSESYRDSALESGEPNHYQTYNLPQQWVPQAEYQPVQQPHHQEQYMQTPNTGETPNTGQVFQAEIVQQQNHPMEPPILIYPNHNQIYQNQYKDPSEFSQTMNTQNVLQPGQYAENSYPNYKVQSQLSQSLDEDQEQLQYQNQKQQQNDPVMITDYNDHDMVNTKWDIVNEQVPIVQLIKTIQNLQEQKSDDQQLETKQTMENTESHDKDLHQLIEDNAIHLLQLNPEKGKTIVHSDLLRKAKLLWKGQTMVDEEIPPQQETNYQTQLEEIQLLQQQLLQQQKYLLEVLARESNSNNDKNEDTILQKSSNLNDNSNIINEYPLLNTQSSPRESRYLQEDFRNPKLMIEKMPRYIYEDNPKPRQLYENPNKGQMTDNFNQKSSMPEYPFDNKMKRLNEPEMYYHQNQDIVGHYEFTDKNIKNRETNGMGYDYSYDKITAFNHNKDLNDDGLSNFAQDGKWEEFIPEPQKNKNDFPYIDDENWEYVSSKMIDNFNNINNAQQFEHVGYNDYVSNADENDNVFSPRVSLAYNLISDNDIYSTIDEMQMNSVPPQKIKYTHPKYSVSNGNNYNAHKFTYKIPQDEISEKSFSYKYPKSSTPINSEIDIPYKFQKTTNNQEGGIDASYMISNNIQEINDTALENDNYYYLFDKPSDNRTFVHKNNIQVAVQSQNHDRELKQPINVNNGDFNYKYRRERKMNLNNLKKEHFENEFEVDNFIEKENSHHTSDINAISLDAYRNIKYSPECDENCKIEIIRRSNKSNVITNGDQTKIKMTNNNNEYSTFEKLGKCDPWNPHTKTETVTSNTNTDEGTLKRIVSKKSCNNKHTTNKFKQNTPCLITVTTETTIINEYCLLPKYQDKDNVTSPCFKNTTTTHSVITEPCDKTADIQQAVGNITAQYVLYNKSKEIPSAKSNVYKENLEKNIITEKLSTIRNSSSSTIPPKLEVASSMNINISMTDNKIYEAKSDNVSDCVDYKQHSKYSPSSNACIIKSSGVSEEDINIILKLHNLLRSKIARGEEQHGRPGPQPPAANMNELRWNNDLARAAQAWAQQCPQENAPLKYRKICSRTYEVGQNVAYFNAKKDGETQHIEKYNDKTGNGKRKKRFVDQMNGLEDSITEKDISDELYLEDDIIGDGRSMENAVINDYSNDDESLLMDDFSKDEVLIALDTIEDKVIEDDSNEDALIGNEILIGLDTIEDKVIEDYSNEEALINNVINKSEEIIIDKVKSNEDFAITEETLIGYSDHDLSGFKKNIISDENLFQDIEKDFTSKSHSFETELKNLIIFNSLNMAHNKEKGWKNVILEWYKGVEEFPNYMASSIKDLKRTDKEEMQEYFQVVWAETEEIGCTVIHYTDNEQNEDDYKEERISSIYVCNYGPAASKEKSSLYAVGDAVSYCPDGVSPTYPDLCRSNSSIA